MFHSDRDGRPLKDFVIKVTVSMRPRMDAGRLVYSFLRAAMQITINVVAQNTKNLFSMVLEAKVLKSSCQQAHAPSAGSRRESFLLLLVLMLQLFLGLWRHHSNLHLHLYTALSSVSMPSPLLSLLRRLVIGFMASLDSPG